MYNSIKAAFFTCTMALAILPAGAFAVTRPCAGYKLDVKAKKDAVKAAAKAWGFKAVKKKYTYYVKECEKLTNSSKGNSCPRRIEKLDVTLKRLETQLQASDLLSGLLGGFESDELTGLTCPPRLRSLCSRVTSTRRKKRITSENCAKDIEKYCGKGFEGVKVEYKTNGGDAYDAAVKAQEDAEKAYIACLNGVTT